MNSELCVRKIQRKLRKHQHVVSKETGVTCLAEATKNLALCNIGQVNGLTEDVVVENFRKYGDIDRILLIPGKSCSFLSYKNIESATAALIGANGKLTIAQNNKPVFLTFVEELPQIDHEKIWNELPPGLIVLENFITDSEEEALLSLCNFTDNIDDAMRHRQVRHFGYKFRYDVNNVDKDDPLEESIPKECDFLWQRLNSNHLPISGFNPDQLTVNQYKPGQGIPSHIDTHSAFEDPIVSLSLGSPVVMEFKKSTKTICVILPQRSLAIFSEECRYDWSHGIVPKKFDFYMTNDNYCSSFQRGTRVSFTFRKILQGECNCKYPQNCDSHMKRVNNLQIQDKVAARLENQHVHHVYEDIADHFSSTRHKPWPNVLEFVNSFRTGDILVDVGCGNGKYFGFNQQLFEIGLDRSFKLNELCRHRNFETLTANCLNLPLRDDSADGVISIAVIHHLSTEERRLNAIREMVRILRVNGRALIYVWAKNQVKDNKNSNYIKQDRKQQKSQNITKATSEVVCVSEGVSLPVHTNRTNFDHCDLLVPWKLKNTDQKKEERTLLRFYHVFESGELDSLCLKLSNVLVVKSYYDEGNYCVVLKKVTE